MIKKIMVMICALMVFTGCALNLDDSLAAKIAVQYAAVKVVNDSDSITSSDVTEAVKAIRAAVNIDGVVSGHKILSETKRLINFDKLPLQDQFLVSALFSQVELNLSQSTSEDFRIKLNTVLDWIELSVVGFPDVS